MDSIKLRRPSPALVVALVALFVAMGGTGYAAMKLPKNSVGAAQIKKNAVSGVKVKDGSLGAADFRQADRAALKGDKGQPGPAGPTGAAGRDGQTGPAGPFPDTLPAGKTMRGTFYAAGTGAAAFAMGHGAFSFGYQLSQAPEAHFVREGNPAPAGCGGSAAAPAADPGHLCVYEQDSANVDARNVTFEFDGQVTKFGGSVFVRSVASGDFFSRGTWAVTGG